MARVLVWVPDLLFGSHVVGAVQQAGHEAELVPAPPAALAADQLAADARPAAAVVDLTADAAERIAGARPMIAAGIPTLAFYSHVEADVRAAALEAGFTTVVPRSRMAREGASLVAALVGDTPVGDT